MFVYGKQYCHTKPLLPFYCNLYKTFLNEYKNTVNIYKRNEVLIAEIVNAYVSFFIQFSKECKLFSNTCNFNATISNSLRSNIYFDIYTTLKY